MSDDKDKLYLLHINECIRRIESYVEDGETAFRESTLIQDAVVRNLQTLGESTQRLSADLKAYYPGIPWRKVAAFRNILVHDYLDVDLDLTWLVIHDDLPELKRTISQMLRDFES